MIRKTKSNPFVVAQKNLKTICILAALFFSFCNNSTAQKTATPGIFYAITGNGLKDTSWLFGTYHLIKDGYLETIPEVVRSFKKSNGIVVEIIADSKQSTNLEAITTLKEKTLSAYLDVPFQDSLEKELKASMGVGIAAFQKFKPINIMLNLSMIYMMRDNGKIINGYKGVPLDGFFATEGEKQGKKISALETIEAQMNLLFNKTTIEEQVQQLKYFIRNKATITQQGNQLLENWLKKDLLQMAADAENGLSLFGNEADFLEVRNQHWMQQLPVLMQQSAQFIAVGALHLANDNGLVALLKQKGYTVTPINL